MTTYRIEQWSREGQILRATYVDDDLRPYTLRKALADVDGVRGKYPAAGGLRIVNNSTNQPIDEDYERQPWWLKSCNATAESTHEVARMLDDLSDALRSADDQPVRALTVSVGLSVEYHGADRDDVRRGVVELLARLTGQELTQRGGTYESVGQSVYLSTYALPPVEPEPVDEPEVPELVDGREDPETGEPVPDGVEGHPVGRVVEQTARAALDPDSLPGDDGSIDAVVAQEEARQEQQLDAAIALHEKRCPCGQPWALIISGNARHTDDCPERYASLEAGETEDALGVPGLTSGEADDFMSGGAR